MLKLNLNNIPLFLRNSLFYQNLNSHQNDDEFIEIPKNCFVETPNFNNLEEFKILDKTVKFWCVNELFLTFQNITLILSKFDEYKKSHEENVGNCLDMYFETNDIQKLCAKYNLLDVFDNIPESEISYKLANVAIKYSNIDFLKKLKEKKIKFEMINLLNTAKYGKIECFEYLLEFEYFDFENEENIRKIFFENYNLYLEIYERNIMKLFSRIHNSNYVIENTQNIFEVAIIFNQFEFLVYLFNRFKSGKKLIIAYKIYFSEVDSDIYINKIDYNFKDKSYYCFLAVTTNNFKMLKYLVENGCKLDSRLLKVAKNKNNNSIILYLESMFKLMDINHH